MPATCDPLLAGVDSATVTTGDAFTGTATVTNCSPYSRTYVLTVTVTSVPDPVTGVAPCPDDASFSTLVSLSPLASRTLVRTATPTCAGTDHVTATTSSLRTGQVVATSSVDVTVVDPVVV